MREVAICAEYLPAVTNGDGAHQEIGIRARDASTDALIGSPRRFFIVALIQLNIPEPSQVNVDSSRIPESTSCRVDPRSRTRCCCTKSYRLFEMRRSRGAKSTALRRKERDQTGVSTSTIMNALRGATPCSRTPDRSPRCRCPPESEVVCGARCTVEGQSSPLPSWSYAHPSGVLPR